VQYTASVAADCSPQTPSEIRRLIDAGRLAAARDQCSDALRRHPDNVALNLLAGQINFRMRRLDAAKHFLWRVAELQPDLVDAQHLLSVVLDHGGDRDGALRAARNAHRLEPDNAEICSNLGALLTSTDTFNDAEAPLTHARKLDDRQAVICDNLGNLYRKQLRHEESLEQYLNASALEPNNVSYRIHAIKARDCCPDTDPRAAFEFVRATGDLVEARYPPLFDSYREPPKKLRIGYLGSTLRRHSVTHFLLPILQNHGSGFSIFAYNAGRKEDDTTKRIRDLSEGYRHVHATDADEIARQIHADGINILFDLDGYTEAGTIRVLARKPAPIQVAWIGCPGSLGMSRVDYRIVDKDTDPVGSIADRIHAEKLIRMPQCFSVYSAPVDSPPVNETPARKNGYITFGSFNVPTKLNTSVFRVWANVLRNIPDSVLILKTPLFDQRSMRDNVRAGFAKYRVSGDRLRFMGFDADSRDHLRRYHDIDIALDPFPYNGTTTSCDAMWMGVPVVTLAGDRHIARVGVTLLNNVGNSALVARDYDHYVEIAKELAGNIERLDAARLALRQRMLDSPLMNGAKFTALLEAKLHRIWHEQFPLSR